MLGLASLWSGRFQPHMVRIGPPILAESLPRLFQSMVLGNLSGAAHSVGLGLYIVSKIAEAHGGRVTVTSDSEARKAFTLIFPIEGLGHCT